MQIGAIKLASPIVVGPMAGVSNQAFRKVVSQYEPGLIYSEMVSDKAIVYQNEKTLRMTRVDEDEGLVSMQLFGMEIPTMVKAAQYLDQKSNCRIIDINMGCPVNKVVSGNGGASLMKDPEYAGELVYAIKQAVKKPVTVKIRSGWDEQSKNAILMAQKLEQAGADALAIHGRTRTKMYSGAVDLDMIKAVKAAVKIPVIGNGDIVDGASAKNMLEHTGVDGIMIARALWGQPWLVKEVDAYLQDQPFIMSIKERFDVTIAFARALVTLKGEMIAIKEMRSHGAMAIKGYPHASQVRAQIAKASTLVELIEILETYQAKLLMEGIE